MWSVFLGFLLVVAFADSDDPLPRACRFTGQVFPLSMADGTVSEDFVRITKVSAIRSAKTDFQGFCEWNRMDRASGVFRDSSDYIAAKREGDRDRAGALIGRPPFFTPWERSLLGNAEAKKGPEDSSMLSLRHQVDPKRFTGIVAGRLSDPRLEGTNRLQDHRGLRDARIHEVSTVERMAACKMVTGTINVLSCSSSLERLIPMMPTHGAILAPKLIRETLGKRSYTKALQKVAASLWARLDSKNFSPESNIYDELQDAFRETGFDPAEARRASLEVLGTISTGGANFFHRLDQESKTDIEYFPDRCLGGKSCDLNAVFLTAIAEGISHADTIKMRNRPAKPYSLPGNMDFPCDSGKSYHFWMSAYFANKLREQGSSREGARSAVYTSHLGYHAARRSLAGNSDEVEMLKMGRYTSPENGLRMDMVLSAAGATFGSDLDGASNAVFDGHGAYIKMLEEGDTDPTRRDGHLRSPSNFLTWVQRLSPRTALDSF